MFDINYVFQILPRMLGASVLTFEATLGGMSFAIIGGLILAVGRLSRRMPIQVLVICYVEFFRTTPLLVQLFFLFFFLPTIGLTLPALVAGIVGLGLHYSSYTSEVYRSGVESVPRGQWEAAYALNLSPARTWVSIILPQAIPSVIPALGNYLLAMFKDTPVLFTITVTELLGRAMIEADITYRYFEPLAIIGVIFLALSIPASFAVRQVERQFARRSTGK
jgi:polar amino acid transport system permease protein